MGPGMDELTSEGEESGSDESPEPNENPGLSGVSQAGRRRLDPSVPRAGGRSTLRPSGGSISPPLNDHLQSAELDASVTYVSVRTNPEYWTIQSDNLRAAAVWLGRAVQVLEALETNAAPEDPRYPSGVLARIQHDVSTILQRNGWDRGVATESAEQAPGAPPDQPGELVPLRDTLEVLYEHVERIQTDIDAVPDTIPHPDAAHPFVTCWEAAPQILSATWGLWTGTYPELGSDH